MNENLVLAGENVRALEMQGFEGLNLNAVYKIMRNESEGEVAVVFKTGQAIIYKFVMEM